MTTSTTDAEAIARIIDPLAFDVEKQTFCTPAYWKFRSEHAVCTANAILSYLASQREAPEPVAGELLPCPFCGGAAEIERYGTPSVSTVYRCTECACRLETGEEWNHGADWNRRTAPPSPAPAGEVEQ